MNPNNCTLAAHSAGGARIRIMVKLKTCSIKVDLKLTNNALGKALVSDTKPPCSLMHFNW